MGLLSRAADKSSVEPLSFENPVFAFPAAASIEEVPETAPPTQEDAPEINALEEKIAQYHENYADFHCLVFDLPNSESEDDKDNFFEKVSNMINKAGSVIPLSMNRPLILLPVTMDRELIAHRISKSLKTMPLLSFEANNPENALNKINSLL